MKLPEAVHQIEYTVANPVTRWRAIVPTDCRVVPLCSSSNLSAFARGNDSDVRFLTLATPSTHPQYCAAVVILRESSF